MLVNNFFFFRICHRENTKGEKRITVHTLNTAHYIHIFINTTKKIPHDSCAHHISIY